MLAAPGRLSITTVCATSSDSFWPMMRPVTSEPPPGANGTTMRIGRSGQLSAASKGSGEAASSSDSDSDSDNDNDSGRRITEGHLLFM